MMASMYRKNRLSRKPTTSIIEGARFRSGLEKKVALGLQGLGVTFDFEPGYIEYIKPARVHKYLPDFICGDIIIEAKGRFEAADRQKHLLIRETHGTPEEGGPDIRFLFQNPNQKINKRSKTTYAMWCDRHGFRYGTLQTLEDLLNDA